MGKKQKKLIDEEIEQHRNETYQMMAAMSGKQVSELMGESTSRPNYKENYCLIKQMYLKNCAEPISSRQLYELLQKQGYKAKYSTFRGLTNYYMKNGYICKTNAKKPFLYILTAEGKLHAKNPFILVEENIKRYRNMLLQKTKELIESEPEQFKSIYKSIHGAQPVINTVIAGTGTQYSPNDIGSDLQQELESQIFTPDFFKNADELKLNSLVDGILNNSLTPDQKKELILDAIDQARTIKSSIIFKQQEYNPSKSIGERKYYSILVNSIDKPITRSVYENLPFKFIYVENKKELRLESVSVAGVYRNHEDGKILDFDFPNRTYFSNNMMIKTKPNNDKRELEFYYVGGYKNFKITTMSFPDYQKAANKSRKQSVTINVQRD